MAAPNGIIGEAVDTHQLKHSNAVSQDPALQELGLAQGSEEAVCMPLMMNGQVEGALVLTHPKAGFFTSRRLKRLSEIGAQASIALHNARILRALVIERDRMYWELDWSRAVTPVPSDFAVEEIRRKMTQPDAFELEFRMRAPIRWWDDDDDA